MDTPANMLPSACLPLAVLLVGLVSADRELLSTTDGPGQVSIDWLAALGTGSAPIDLADPRLAANTAVTDAEQVCSCRQRTGTVAKLDFRRTRL